MVVVDMQASTVRLRSTAYRASTLLGEHPLVVVDRDAELAA
jgi:hypothetical protein